MAKEQRFEKSRSKTPTSSSLIRLGFKDEEVLDPVQVKRRRFQI